MNIDLLTDFESVIQTVAETYFVTGFLTGFVVCTLMFIVALFLSR